MEQEFQEAFTLEETENIPDSPNLNFANCIPMNPRAEIVSHQVTPTTKPLSLTEIRISEIFSSI